ncbi:DUF1127 domain-containing protein [Pelagibius sp.]|uniref:DUF1127 domain-containing protein n=1 Tax=Pelagibius sp. TaxID=1931238 RepID=UPI002AC3593D|nr:DUF1127 domain-containing protein [Pelagibius sp.]
MTRLNELHDAAWRGSDVRWDPRSVDVLNAVQTARRMRAQYTAELLTRGLSALARWSGATALVSTLARAQQRRRTLRELTALSDSMLADIGLQRSQIAAAAADVVPAKPAAGSVWHMMAEWLGREYRKSRTIRELSGMSDAMLRDIGVERADIGRIAEALAAKQRDGQTAAAATAALQRAPQLAGSLSAASVSKSSADLLVPANENLGHPTAA